MKVGSELRYNPAMEDVTGQSVSFRSGVHCSADFAAVHLTPCFEDGTITPYPSADYYAVWFGNLCAYDENGCYLATWSALVPDCADNVGKRCDGTTGNVPDYSGEWVGGEWANLPP